MVQLFFAVISLVGLITTANAQGLDCAQYSASIMNNIDQAYQQTIAASQGNPECANLAAALAEGGRWMKEHCVDMVTDAVGTCNGVKYEVPKSNTGTGVSDTSGRGTTGVAGAVDNLRLQGRRCGEKLAPIPRSCAESSKIFHQILVEAKCHPDQIKNVQAQRAPMAKAGIERFCSAVSKHYQQTKENLQAQAVAQQNLRTNKKTNRKLDE